MPRKHNHPNAPHCFGGMLILVKHLYFKGTEIVLQQCDHMCVLKLDKKLFQLQNDLFIIGAYFNPHDSTYKCETCSGDYFNQLESFISSNENNGDIIIAGDLNARTGLEPDYIGTDFINFATDNHNSCPAANHVDFSNHLMHHHPKRFSKDNRVTNLHGHELLRLCKNSCIQILNGRYGNDVNIGDFTCIKSNGKSVIDYILCSYGILNKQSNFTVHRKQPESDHKPISVDINIGHTLPLDSAKCDTYQCFKWDHSKLVNIKQSLCDLNNPFLHNFLNSMIMNCSSNQVAHCFDKYVNNTLNVHLKVKSFNSKSTFPANAWYDNECKVARRNLKNCDIDSIEYINAGKEYKRVTQSRRRQHQSSLIHMLNTEKDTSKTWSLLHSIHPKSKTDPPFHPGKIKEALDAISHDEPSFDKEFEKQCLDFLNMFDEKDAPKCDITTELLDTHFTQDELDATLMSLKDKKSSGLDGVPSEAFKYTADVLGDTLLILINYILDKGSYPDKWAEGLISPVYKSGDRNDCKNYRRITVQAAISKIFDTMTNNRLIFLTDILDKDDKYNGGFKKGSCTADNIFVLLSLIEKQKALGKPLYISFIDFRRAFDSVNRTLLFHKLIKSGYHGKLITLLKDMYSKTKSRVKIKNLLSDFLIDSHGVNQGGVSSPFLFKAFLADFKQYLNAKCGISMSYGDILTHILWADDLILIAESASELQLLLDNVYDYCKRWQLLVNLSKTKIMIINGKKCDSQSIFTYNDVPLDTVHKYKYLGIIISDGNNNFLDHIMYTETVANRALFSLQGYLYSLNQTPPPISMKLFDTLVMPIIEYGSEIWSTCTSFTSLETLYLRFLKCILGVRPQTTTTAVFGDVGRFPLFVKLQVKAIKFWCKLISKPSGSLPRIAYEMLLSLRNFGFPTWLDKIFDILEKCNLSSYFDSTSLTNVQIKFITTQAKANLQLKYIENWNSEIHKLPKLRTYKLFKTSFQTELYLHIFNKNHRQALSRFRLSAHTLEIEKGRWTRKINNGKWVKYKTPIEQRLCIFCNDKVVESESHVLMSCSKYSDIRIELLVSASEIIPDFNNFDINAKFIALLQSDQPRLLQKLAQSVYRIFKRRIDILNDSKCNDSVNVNDV